MKRKILAGLLILSTLACGMTPVYAIEQDTFVQEEIMPRYTAVNRVIAAIDIQYGMVIGAASYSLKSTSQYDYTVTLTIESSTDEETWEEVKSWSVTPSSTSGAFEKKWAVYSRHYYQVVVTVDVYTKGGSYVESATATSSSMYLS